ncbi:MAG: DUF3293 domain-containing protein [Wenzhouxiangellaceae bacterium]|nr:DUF3293 domain-containing protein [Wenzhouxiangellaceae bacterium]
MRIVPDAGGTNSMKVPNCSGSGATRPDRNRPVMLAKSESEPSLINCFVQAIYEVEDQGRRWRLVPGEIPLGPPALDTAEAWCVITAHNPGARRCSEERNRAAANALEQSLRAQAPSLLLPTVHRDPAGDWPDEPGWLFGCRDPGQVHALARRFDQLGVLRGQTGQAVELWLYPEHKHRQTVQNATDTHSEFVRIMTS